MIVDHLDRSDLEFILQYCIQILYFQFVSIVHIWVIDEHIAVNPLLVLVPHHHIH